MKLKRVLSVVAALSCSMPWLSVPIAVADNSPTYRQDLLLQEFVNEQEVKAIRKLMSTHFRDLGILEGTYIAAYAEYKIARQLSFTDDMTVSVVTDAMNKLHNERWRTKISGMRHQLEENALKEGFVFMPGSKNVSYYWQIKSKMLPQDYNTLRWGFGAIWEGDFDLLEVSESG